MRVPSRLLFATCLCASLSGAACAQGTSAPSVRRPQTSSRVQELVQRAQKLTKQHQFAPATRLLEVRLKKRVGITDKAVLQNAIADVHYAWGLYLHHSACTISWRSDFKWRDSDFEKAIAHFQRAYSTDKVLRPHNAINDLLAISVSHINDYETNFTGVNKKAALYCHWALAASRKFHYTLGQAASLRNLGWLSLSLEHTPQALRYYEQSLVLYRKLPYARREQGARLLNIGFLNRKLGRFDEEIRLIEEARQIFRSVNFSLGQAWTWDNAGGCYAEFGRFDKALPCFQRARTYYQRDTSYEGVLSTRRILSSIGWAYMGLKQYKKALAIFEKVLPLDREANDLGAQIDVFLNMGDTYMRLERYSEALPPYKQCLAALQKEPNAVYDGLCRSGMGTAYLRLKRYPQALQLFNQSLNFHRRSGYSIGQVEALGRISETYALLNQPEKAIAYGKQTVNGVQTLRRDNRTLDAGGQSLLLASHRQNYERLAALLVKAKRLDEAEQVLRFLRQQDAFEFAKRDPKLRHELASLFQPLFYSATEKQQLPAFLAQSAVVGQGVSEGQRWQQALQWREQDGAGRAALLSTFNTNDRFYLLLTTAKTRRAFSLPIKRTKFDALTRRLQSKLSTPTLDPRPDALQLYKTVFCNDQLERALQQEGITTALWFTSGSLRAIPIDALYDGTLYLVQKERVNTSVTLTSRRLFGDTQGGATLAAGVSHKYTVKAYLKGDAPLSFNALSYVPQELRSIVQDPADGGVGPFPGKVLLDHNFTAKALEKNLAQGASTVHIATHFSLAPSSYEESFLLMGDGKPLPVSQWKQSLKLQDVQLLTLSACETGIGSPDANGGEVSSIGEISQWLGAHSVIVSLWPVADASTATLMSDFYTRWHNFPQQGKAQALREAQRALLGSTMGSGTANFQRGKPQQLDGEDDGTTFVKDPAHPYAHPFYWAPFSLIGNWK